MRASKEGGAGLFSPARAGRWVRGACLAAVAALGLTFAGSAAALAHTALVGSDPADGAVVAAAPARVALDFTRDAAPQLTRASLTDSEGRTQQIPASSISADSRLQTRLWIRLPRSLGPDSYRLSYTTHDSVDLHETSGAVVFGVAVAAVQRGQAAQVAPPSPLEVALRWVEDAGLAAVLGALALAFLVLPAALQSGGLAAAQRRSFGLGLAGLAAVAAGETGLLVTQLRAAGVGGDVAALLLTSDFGRRWLVGLAFAIGLAPLLWWLRRGVARGRPCRGLVAGLRREGAWALLSASTRAWVLATGLAVALAVSGHSGGDSAPTPAGVALRTLHLVSVSGWAGGLFGLTLLLGGVPAARAAAWPLLRAFSPFAAVCFGAAAVTGLLLMGGVVDSVTALLATGYGVTLLVKVALVGAVGLLGLRHAILIARRGSRAGGGEPRTLLVEAAGALAVVLLAGMLGATVPATGPQFDPAPPPAPPLTQTVDVNDLLVRLSIKPNLPGRNLVSVDVVSKRRPVPAPIKQVSVVVTRPGLGPQVLTAALGDGASRYDAGAVDLTTGDLGVSVEVDRPPLPATTQRFAWSVAAATPPRHPVVFSDARMTPIAQSLAAAGTLIAVVVALAVWRRRRRRYRPAEVEPQLSARGTP